MKKLLLLLSILSLQLSQAQYSPPAGGVPASRTINGHDLSSNITLTIGDVGAASAAQGALADTALQSESDPLFAAWGYDASLLTGTFAALDISAATGAPALDATNFTNLPAASIGYDALGYSGSGSSSDRLFGNTNYRFFDNNGYANNANYATAADNATNATYSTYAEYASNDFNTFFHFYGYNLGVSIDSDVITAAGFVGDGSGLTNLPKVNFLWDLSSNSFGFNSGAGWQPIDYNQRIASNDGITYFDNSGFVGRLTSPTAPAADASGVAGQMIFTDTYTYRCFGDGDWRRSAAIYSTY